MKQVQLYVRKVVSKDKNRFNDGEFDLDLTYITDRIIAMGFPASGVEGVFRNHIDEVCRLLKERHGNNYLIWNLSERAYDYKKFDNQIIEFGFPDHHSPPLELLIKIIHSMDSWMKADEKNVAVVHCLAGKGRTGTVIACYLTYSGMFVDPLAALDFFASRRSSTDEGVTQPSQRRYVGYFSDILSKARKPLPVALKLKRVTMTPVPRFDSKDGCRPYIQVYSTKRYPKTLIYNSVWQTDNIKSYSGKDNMVIWDLECIIKGDCLVKCCHLASLFPGVQSRVTMFRCSFHTAFISDKGIDQPSDAKPKTDEKEKEEIKLVLKKREMENTIKDKSDRFDDNFTVTFYFDDVIEDAKEGKAEVESLDLQNFLRVRENNLKELSRKRKDTSQREGTHRRRRAVVSQDNSKLSEFDPEEDDAASLEDDELRNTEHIEDNVKAEEEEDDVVLNLNITDDGTYMDEDSYIEDISLITCENP